METRSKGINLCIVLIAILAAGVLLIELKGILMPLVFAFFLMNLVGPSMSFLRRKGTPMSFAMLITVILTALTIYLLGRIYYTQVPILQQELPRYTEILSNLYRQILDNIPEKARDLLNIDLSKMVPKGAQAVFAAVGGFLSLLKVFLIILVYLIFLLLERDQFEKRIKAAYTEKEGGRFLVILENIQQQTENYIVGKTMISLAVGVAVTLVLWIFGVKFFFVWGLLTFLLNFIPYIGSIIATALPLLMAAVQLTLSQGQEAAAFTFGKIAFLALMLVAAQMTVGSILEPRVLGHRLQLSPLMVFISFMIWGWLWGLPGVILSTPILATIKIIFENVEALKPCAVLISTGKAVEGKEKPS